MRCVDADHLKQWILSRVFKTQLSVADVIDQIDREDTIEPERLTDDDFETIRIHLNAYKEKLCNQGRWKEAVKYQNIIDRFMAFASAQPEIVRCKNCEYCVPGYITDTDDFISPRCGRLRQTMRISGDDYCSFGERRTDGRD